jgi:hypothetical protein
LSPSLVGSRLTGYPLQAVLSYAINIQKSVVIDSEMGHEWNTNESRINENGNHIFSLVTLALALEGLGHLIFCPTMS